MQLHYFGRPGSVLGWGSTASACSMLTLRPFIAIIKSALYVQTCQKLEPSTTKSLGLRGTNSSRLPKTWAAVFQTGSRCQWHTCSRCLVCKNLYFPPVDTGNTWLILAYACPSGRFGVRFVLIIQVIEQEKWPT